MNIPIKKILPESEIDSKRIQLYDKCRKTAQKDILKKASWLILFVIIISILFFIDKEIWSIIPGMLALVYIHTLVQLWRTDTRIPYLHGILRPAIIAGTDPLILVSITTQYNSETITKWGFQCFTAGNLPECNLIKGEHISCAGIYERGFRFNEMYIALTPHPLVWATSNKEILHQADKLIAPKEWEILQKMAPAIAAQEKEYGRPAQEKTIHYYSQYLIDSTTDLTPEDNYPEELFSNLTWAFVNGTYCFFSHFQEIVKKENKKSHPSWDPAQKVLTTTEVAIHYDYTYWDKYTEEEKEAEEILLLKTHNPEGFTAGELLYKLHNNIVENVQYGENRFFIDLTLCPRKTLTGTPLYLLNREFRVSSMLF